MRVDVRLPVFACLCFCIFVSSCLSRSEQLQDTPSGLRAATAISEVSSEVPAAVLSQHYWRYPIHTGALDQALRRCESCHAREHADWQSSLHAHAVGPGLTGQAFALSKTAYTSCLVCHAPLLQQQPLRLSAIPKNCEHMGDFRHVVEEYACAQQRGVVGRNPAYVVGAEQKGITCAGCHVRDGKIFGPPHSSDAEISTTGVAHRVVRSDYFRQAAFCATCHQFAVNPSAKHPPLENTYAEWRGSKWSELGVQCQSCHMPEGAHIWRGIHDRRQVEMGVGWDLRVSSVSPTIAGDLVVENLSVGHSFPTYTTPRIEAVVTLEDSTSGAILGKPQRFVLQRDISWDGSRFVERSDTRLRSGEQRSLSFSFASASSVGRAQTVRLRVTVFPDAYYDALYGNLLTRTDAKGEYRVMLNKAKQRSAATPYLLYEQRFEVPLAQ